MFFRIVQGIGAAFLNVCAYSIAAVRYTESIDSVMAILKITVGVGLVVGPPIGSVIFSYAGFSGPFIFFFIVFIVLLILVCLLIPESVEDELLYDPCEANQLNSGAHASSYHTIPRMSHSREESESGEGANVQHSM